MPEGPEVRRHADALSVALNGKLIVSLSSRLRGAKAWLQEHPGVLNGRRIQSVRSHGKHVIGLIEGDFYFHSHLMMWGRWHIVPNDGPVAPDRRERARIEVADAIALLHSAPIFELGQGDPYDLVDNLRTLGPDILPYDSAGPFDKDEFLKRLLSPEHLPRTIGAALLDQQISAGIGNYLRAEILFDCRLNPWMPVADLDADALDCLCRTIATLTQRAYQEGGRTVTEEERDQMQHDPSLLYRPGSEWQARHWVFRRTNLPCVRCRTIIRQQRQVTYADEENEKTRIIYFCPSCQNVPVEEKPKRRKRATVSSHMS